jgi:hypothetical protein
MGDPLTEAETLRKTIAESLSPLRQLLVECQGERADEEFVYRYYHQSYKVYRVQEKTERIVKALESLAPHLPLNSWFLEIVHEGTGKVFDRTVNDQWAKTTRPILEAFFHARYFLEMVCKYGEAPDDSFEILPTGWAAVLTLYNLR